MERTRHAVAVRAQLTHVGRDQTFERPSIAVLRSLQRSFVMKHRFQVKDECSLRQPMSSGNGCRLYVCPERAQHMTTPFESAVLLTVRGTFIPPTLVAMR